MVAVWRDFQRYGVVAQRVSMRTGYKRLLVCSTYGTMKRDLVLKVEGNSEFVKWWNQWREEIQSRVTAAETTREETSQLQVHSGREGSCESNASGQKS